MISRILHYLFGYESIEYCADLSAKIYNALSTNDIEVINKYCTSKEAIDIMAQRICDIQFFRSNSYTYKYDEKHFDSVTMLKNLYKNKESMHICEFIALLSYLRKSIVFGFGFDQLDFSFSGLSFREISIYSKFLDRV